MALWSVEFITTLLLGEVVLLLIPFLVQSTFSLSLELCFIEQPEGELCHRTDPCENQPLIFSWLWVSLQLPQLCVLLWFTLWPHGTVVKWAGVSSLGERERDVVIVKGRFKGKVPSLSLDCLFIRQHGVCDSANNVNNQQPGRKGGEQVLFAWSGPWADLQQSLVISYCWHSFGNRGTEISGQEEWWQGDECQGLLWCREDKLRNVR